MRTLDVMPKIAFIGAGSTVFTRNLIGDVLSVGGLSGSTFALMDIDPERLRTSEIVARRLVEAHGDWIPAFGPGTAR